MTYKIVIDKPAMKFLQKQPKNQQERILKAIQKLPDIGDRKPLTGYTNTFRLRVGDYRIIYTLEKDILVIDVLTIGNRGDIYK